MSDELLIVYDGSCRLCRRTIEALRRRAHGLELRFLAHDTPGLATAHPELDLGDLDSGMRVRDAAGQVWIGADALCEIGCRLPRWRGVAWFLRRPLVRVVVRAIYRAVARRRHRLLAACRRGACRLPDQRSRYWVSSR